jgi:2-(1,2-epoxy-1,2-dihydrophenyl)acetyl-CoA isomerase
MAFVTQHGIEDGIRYQVDDRIGTLVFDRPARHNALDVAMQRRYGELLRAAEADRGVRAVIITGAGRSFCPGVDIDALAAIPTSGDDRPRLDPSEQLRSVLAAINLAKPVVAAINGGCAGLGFVIACTADVRFAAAGAKFTTAFVRRGLIAEYGLARLLPELVGRGRAMDLLLSGRTFTAEDALAYGLVQEVVPAEELADTARGYAAELATYSAPWSMAEMKRQLRDEADLSVAESAERAAELMVASFRRPELAEGVASYAERRAPDFPPYPD